MTDHKGLPVAGYRQQADEAVQLVNQNKYKEERLLRLIDGLMNEQTPDGMSISVDKRWLSIARTHLEEGFMALNRAIFQPQRIQGDI